MKEVILLNRRLRETFIAGAGVIMPGAGNALTARLIELTGHSVFVVSGAAIANSHMAAPDIGLVSLHELVDHVFAIRDATAIPMLVDADTGFGNAINVDKTVRSLERAGANAIMLEDQVFPKRCGHFENKDVISKGEMVDKIKAAVDARLDGNLMILARTDARAVEGLDAALERAGAYQEVGADMLFVEAPLSVEELASIPRALPGIHVCNMVIGGKTPMPSREELSDMGYAVVSYANIALQASMLAMQQVLEHLWQTGSTKGIEDKLMPFSDRQIIVGAEHFRALAAKYGTAPL